MITLAIIAKHNPRQFRELIDSAIDHVDQILVALDEGAQPGIAGYCAERVIYHQHPLNRDFAAQRNFLADMATEPWILNLDTDENLCLDMWHRLPHWLLDVDSDVVLMPRLTLIDGKVAGWPDWQPKLVRFHIRWERSVHEWPRQPYTAERTALDVRWAILHTKTAEEQATSDALYATYAQH